MKLRVACRAYDRTRAILSGRLEPEGFEIEAVEATSVPAMFAAMHRGESDVSEMSLAELVYATSRDRSDFVGVPVFPSRVFRHGFIFCNTAAGIDDPASLDGKRIGFPRYVQTACVWIRGMLVEEYGISPERTGWFVARAHHWDDDRGLADLVPRDGATVRLLDRNGAEENAAAERALLEGTIDALGTANVPRFFDDRDRRARRLFERYREVEAAYFRKTRLFPIMHLVAIRQALVERHPALPEIVFRLFVRARRLGKEWARMDPSLGLVWKNRYLDDEEAAFGGDPWTYGLSANTHAVATFLGYCDALGIAARPLTPRDLFAPSTWDLREDDVP